MLLLPLRWRLPQFFVLISLAFYAWEKNFHSHPLARNSITLQCSLNLVRYFDAVFIHRDNHKLYTQDSDNRATEAMYFDTTMNRLIWIMLVFFPVLMRIQNEIYSFLSVRPQRRAQKTNASKSLQNVTNEMKRERKENNSFECVNSTRLDVSFLFYS